MKFFMITSKHHDGFCLWNSQLTDFKVTNSAFKRDIIAELAVALQDRGIALHFYYSLVDWTAPLNDSLRTCMVEFGQVSIAAMAQRTFEMSRIVRAVKKLRDPIYQAEWKPTEE